MLQKIKPIIQIFMALALAIIALALMLTVEFNLSPRTVFAQEPQDTVLPMSAEIFATFGLSAQAIQATDVLSYDLEIAKTAALTSVVAGNPITYTIVITNRGPNTIHGFYFKDYLPAEMKNVAFLFNATGAISDNATVPLWFIYQTLPQSATTIVTVTGILTSPYTKIVSNRAEVLPFTQGEITSTNNASQVGVTINGSSSLYFIYLPLIRKDPPVPILVYWDDFSNSGGGWLHKKYTDVNNHCYNYYDGGKYRINANNSVCWGWSPWVPVPVSPYYDGIYGSFEVEGYISEGNSNAAWGIYSNGSGGSIQYILRILPNNTGSCPSNGSWEFLKNNSSKGGGPGTCNATIKPGLSVTNTLKITHLTNGTIVSYINNTPVYTYPDGSAHLTGTGTGVYVDSDTPNTNNVIKFDNFKIYTLPR